MRKPRGDAWRNDRQSRRSLFFFVQKPGLNEKFNLKIVCDIFVSCIFFFFTILCKEQKAATCAVTECQERYSSMSFFSFHVSLRH
jgi:hypothetical protein